MGAMLRKRRQSLKLSVADIEMATKIRGKFLTSLETCDYLALPNDIYSRGFVQCYADFLGLDGATVAMQFQNERGAKPKPTAPKKKAEVKSRRMFITPRLLLAVLSLAIAGGIVAYLSYQFQGLSAAPRLSIISPSSDLVIDGSLTAISGSVAGGADVFVNDSPILVDAAGNFSDKLALQDGVNSIRITAKNRLGKTATITRSILAKVPKIETTPVATADASHPAGTIVGVQVVISIKGAATALIVEVDGKEEFRGTVVDGVVRTYKGTSTVKITTNNAGATSLKITNTIAADKLISPVGASGEIKRGLEFAKDTVIQ